MNKNVDEDINNFINAIERNLEKYKNSNSKGTFLPFKIIESDDGKPMLVVEEFNDGSTELPENSSHKIKPKEIINFKVLTDISNGVIEDGILEPSEMKKVDELLESAKRENRPFNYEFTHNGEKIFISSFKTMDGDKLFNEIKNKKNLTNDDVKNLSLIHLMDSKYSVGEVILEIAKFTNTITLEKEDMEYLKANQYMSSMRFVDDEKILDKIMKEIDIDKILEDYE